MAIYLTPNRYSEMRRPSLPHRVNGASPQARGLVAWWTHWNRGTITATKGNFPLNDAGLPINPFGVGVQMGRGFTGSGDTGRFIYTSPAVSGLPLTLCAWCTGTRNGLNQKIAEVSAFDWVTQDLGTQSYFSLELNFSINGSVAARTLAAGDIAAETGSLFSSGVPFHACAVFASTTSRAVYFNGQNKVTESSNVGSPGTLLYTYLGTDGLTTGSSFLSGTIFEARVYNRALTDAEVWALYDQRTRWELYALAPRDWSAFQVGVTPVPSPFLWMGQTLVAGAGRDAMIPSGMIDMSTGS